MHHGCRFVYSAHDMSPFSILLRQLRDQRRLKQKDLAELLGYEQSYISSLETGQKGIPRQEFIERLIKGLKLTVEECSQLENAIEVSSRQCTIPLEARPEEFELFHRLNNLLGRLSLPHLELLRLAVRLAERESDPDRRAPEVGVGYRRTYSMEDCAM